MKSDEIVEIDIPSVYRARKLKIFRQIKNLTPIEIETWLSKVGNTTTEYTHRVNLFYLILFLFNFVDSKRSSIHQQEVS